MKKPSAFVLSLSFLFCVCVLSCDNSVDDMLEEYNKGFHTWHVSGTEYPVIKPVLKPDDPGWDQDMLLYEEYFLYEDGMLILGAPDNCVYAGWTFFDPDNEYNEVPVMIRSGTDEKGSITYFTGTVYTGDLLTMYVPESGLTGPKTYQLQLKVISKGGNTYTDNCGIVIYQRYDR